jgi:hypothetical protein
VPPLRPRRRKLSPLCRGNLQNGAGAPVGNDAPCGDFAADGEERKSLVEEVEIEGKTHAEGVHAGATGNEKADADFVAFQIRKPKQAGVEASRNRNLPAEHRASRKATQARSKKTIPHQPYKPLRRRILPTPHR